MAQALINAQHQVNLAVLPSFSDNVKEDKYRAAQWLQKVSLHRQAAAWTDNQIITHVRNALKDRVIDWFDALPSYGVSRTCGQKFKQDLKLTSEPNPHQLQWLQKFQKSNKQLTKTSTTTLTEPTKFFVN